MLRSLLSALEELTLLVIPHGGQRTARRNAWRAAADLHLASAPNQYRDAQTLARLLPTSPPRVAVGAES